MHSKINSVKAIITSPFILDEVEELNRDLYIIEDSRLGDYFARSIKNNDSPYDIGVMFAVICDVSNDTFKIQIINPDSGKRVDAIIRHDSVTLFLNAYALDMKISMFVTSECMKELLELRNSI
jgi:hypothetical protein